MLCAMIACAFSPLVSMLPVLETETADAVCPAPPLPPRLMPTEAAPGRPGGAKLNAPLTEKPPLPPPPPMLCATIPRDCEPKVRIAPLLVTDTTPAVPPPPPLPPRPTAAEIRPPLAATENPPSPPPPPMLCATIALESRPVVVIAPVLLTVTLAAAPPLPPLPPKPTVTLTPDKPAATAKPPLPPPPPMLCAEMPFDWRPLVEMVAAVVTFTTEPAPPLPPEPPRATAAEKSVGPEALTANPPLPPPPPTLCARMPDA